MKLIDLQNNEQDPDELLDVLSTVYRYMLGNKSRELIALESEVNALRNLVALYDFLPHTKVEVVAELEMGPIMVIPGALFQVAQELIRITIPSKLLSQQIRIEDADDCILLKTTQNDRIGVKFSLELIDQLNSNYQIYSDAKVKINTDEKERIVRIPKITITLN